MDSENEFYDDDDFDSDPEDVVSDIDEPEEMSDKFLTKQDLESEMNETISDVQSVLQMAPGVCRLLLQKFNWNKNSLMEKFYENPDAEFLIEANVLPRKDSPGKTDKTDEPSECEICCMEGTLLGLDCNHLACQDCWIYYLSEKITSGQSEIECMAADCKLLIPDEKVREFIGNPSSFNELIINSYVDSNPNLTWCPGVECGRAVKLLHAETRLVTCPCKMIFCFTCGNDGHDPVGCRHLKLWQKKCEAAKKQNSADGYSSDKETFNWILSNTKDCPKCLISIEKNGGCNRITCRNKKCMFEFCWLCLRSWAVHGYSPCNSFDAEAEKNRVDSRAELHRFLFYFNRFMEHDKSLQLEKKLCNTVQIKMSKMQDMLVSYANVQYLRKAVDVLSECRRTLKYTYVFAFYLSRNNHALIFENNQKDLEMAVEQLSGFLEDNLDKEDMTTLNQKVQDKCRYVEHRRKALLDHCTEGNEQDVWVFNE